MRTGARDNAAEVVGILRRAGFDAFFAGGCVRDELLGSGPEDYDVATNARPEDIESLFENTRAVGRQFGVVPVKIGGTVTEVATFRAEGGYSDGRHPDEVAFADAEGDALRRDFTINGMFLDPETGQVFDYVGGRRDLDEKKIRAIGDPAVRFGEDRLRLIRAIRFAARLDFNIEERTADAIRTLAGTLLDVSAERIADELRKALVHPSRASFIRLLDQTGLCRVILPEICELKGVTQSPTMHPEGDVFEHTLVLLEKLEDPSWALAMAGLLHDVGKAPAEREGGDHKFARHADHGARIVGEVASRLKLSNAMKDRVVWLVGKHMALLNVSEMRPGKLRRLFAEEGFEELLALSRADALASHGNLGCHDETMRRYRELSQQQLKPSRIITGGDLLELGLTPGPIFGEILEAVYEEQLEGDVTSREEGVAFVKTILRDRTNRDER